MEYYRPHSSPAMYYVALCFANAFLSAMQHTKLYVEQITPLFL